MSATEFSVAHESESRHWDAVDEADLLMGCDYVKRARCLVGAWASAKAASRENFATCELAASLCVDERTAGAMLAEARLLVELPALADALADGVVRLPRGRVMLTELMPLKTSLAINVLASVLPKAAGRTQAQIRAITRRAVIKADADAAARRRREAVRESRVFVQPEPDGMAKFCGILPATEAMEAYRLVDAHAATYEPDDRTCTRRRHHRAKQTGWTPTPLPDGSILWQSPCGRTYTRPPATDPPEPVDPDATLPPV